MAVNGGAGCPCFRQLGQLGVLERAYPHAWLAAIQLAPVLLLSLPRAPSPPPLFDAATKFAEAAVATVVPWLPRPCGLSSVLRCSGWRSDTCRREAQAAEVVGYS